MGTMTMERTRTMIGSIFESEVVNMRSTSSKHLTYR
jgi:hypothetical protein